MPRSKPYTKKLGVLDVVVTLLTGGAWLLIAAVREMYRFFGPR